MLVRHQHYYSNILSRDTHSIIYGHGGKPVLVLPSQDGVAQDFEGFGMLPSCEPLLNDGLITLYCVDSIDKETWSNYNGNPRSRMELHEKWIQHLTQEYVPFVKADSLWQGRLMALGCSMGGTHSGNLVLRFPNLFDSLIAMSGAFDASWLLHGYMDDIVYINSPVHYMPNLPKDHYFVDALNSCKMVFCAGQGAWEDEMLRTMGILKSVFDEKGINAWIDLWGYDVNHDWPWWRKQLAYFLPIVMDAVGA
ncbi:MAG: esterase family protein [Christensenellales bacterium]|jgi:esterase/lipase superfamily enzyme